MSYPKRWFEAEMKRLRRYANARPSSLWDFSILGRAEKLRDDCQLHVQRDVMSATEIREILRDMAECSAWLYHGVVNRVAPPINLNGMPGPADIRAFVSQDLGQVCFATRCLPPRDKAAAARYSESHLRPVLAKAMDLAASYVGKQGDVGNEPPRSLAPLGRGTDFAR